MRSQRFKAEGRNSLLISLFSFQVGVLTVILAIEHKLSIGWFCGAMLLASVLGIISLCSLTSAMGRFRSAEREEYWESKRLRDHQEIDRV